MTVLQTAKFSLVWENISVDVEEKQNSFWKTTKHKKTILQNISGFANSNSILAIMGPSGSGKTTLLGAISGRIKEKSGTLRINHNVITNDTMKSISSYIQQNDIFTESLTIYEHMKFMTALKLNKTNEERKQVIKRLISELGLEKRKYTKIEFLSGGEKRRLSLATEIINDPLILFCDEPTTGLDSFSAMTVVKKLENLTQTGKIVVLTVHQPSSQLFQHFKDILLLFNGKLVFQGSKLEAKQFFESANFLCPTSYNPADFYMKCLTENSKNNRVEDLAKQFEKFRKIPDETHQWSSNRTFKQKKNTFNRSFFYELKWLTWRVALDTIRNLPRYYVNFSLLSITAIILALSYSTVKIEASGSVQNIQGALAFIVSELIFSHMYYVIYMFPKEVTIFTREKNLYKPLPYYLSKLVTLIPNCLINSCSFLLIYFIILQFLTGYKMFLDMYIILFTTSLVAMGLGLCLSALFPTTEYIDLFIVPLELLGMTLSGLWIKIDTLPKFFGIVKYISPFYFSFQSVSTVQWENVPAIGNCTEGLVLPCYENGKDVLRAYSFLTGNNVVGHNILYLYALFVLYSIVGYLGIIRKRAMYNSY